MNLFNILRVWAGFALNSGGNEPFTGDALQPYIDDVLNELEFLLGDSSTTHGVQRVALGYSEPFYNSTRRHWQRGQARPRLRLFPALPSMTPSKPRTPRRYHCVSSHPLTTPTASRRHSPRVRGKTYRTYSARDDLAAQFNLWDNRNRSIRVFVGEYANRDSDEQQWPYRYWAGAVSEEAVFLIGVERGSDVIPRRLAAYAPTLQHVNGTHARTHAVGARLCQLLLQTSKLRR